MLIDAFPVDINGETNKDWLIGVLFDNFPGQAYMITVYSVSSN